MIVFEGPAQAADAVRRWFYKNEDALPEAVAKPLSSSVSTGTSPVDLIVRFSEFVYANQGDFKKDAKDIAAGCALYCNQQGFHDLGGERGHKIASILAGQDVPGDAPERKADLVRAKDEPTSNGATAAPVARRPRASKDAAK